MSGSAVRSEDNHCLAARHRAGCVGICYVPSGAMPRLPQLGTNGLSRKRGMTRLRTRTASGVEAPSDRPPNGTYIRREGSKRGVQQTGHRR